MPRPASCSRPTSGATGIQDAILRSDGAGGQYLRMQGGGSLNPSSHDTVDNKLHYIEQDGRPVFKAAVTSMADVSYEIMERNGLTRTTFPGSSRTRPTSASSTRPPTAWVWAATR